MAHSKLIVQEVAPDGAFVILNDGGKYLVDVEKHSVAARWNAGTIVLHDSLRLSAEWMRASRRDKSRRASHRNPRCSMVNRIKKA
jgi:hypothetical protein